MSKPKIRLSVMLELKTVEELDRRAKEQNRSLSAVMRQMIEYYLRFGIRNKEKKGAKNVKTR